MKVVRSSASHTGRLYTQEMFLVLIFNRGCVDLRAMERSEGNMSLKNPVTPPGIHTGIFRLVARRLNHYATPGPRYDVFLYLFSITAPVMYALRTNKKYLYVSEIVFSVRYEPSEKNKVDHRASRMIDRKRGILTLKVIPILHLPT
jgi:hypothetical protein